jgi:hypothetical protein
MTKTLKEVKEFAKNHIVSVAACGAAVVAGATGAVDVFSAMGIAFYGFSADFLNYMSKATAEDWRNGYRATEGTFNAALAAGGLMSMANMFIIVGTGAYDNGILNDVETAALCMAPMAVGPAAMYSAAVARLRQR